MSASVHVSLGFSALLGLVASTVTLPQVAADSPHKTQEKPVEHTGLDASADEIPSAELEIIETFTPPKRVRAKPPRYPRQAQQTGKEGWVKLNFMIGPDGRPYDIIVVDSSNERAFEKEAVSAAKWWQYDPARLDGTPIDAGNAVMVTFEISRVRHGAKRSFVKRFRKLQTELTQNNRADAEETLAYLEEKRTSIYEEAYFNLARYQYYARWGSTTDQLQALEKATAMDGDRGFLPDETLTHALQNTLALEVELGRLGHAEITAHQLLKRDPSEKSKAFLDRFLQEMADVRTSQQPFHANGRFDQGTRDFYRLVHQTFAITDIEGDIAELRLHCDKGFRGFIYEPDMVYSINPEWRHCGLVLIGNPHTTYRILDGA